MAWAACVVILLVDVVRAGLTGTSLSRMRQRGAGPGRAGYAARTTVTANPGAPNWRNVARWFAGGQPVEALVFDDTGFAKDRSVPVRGPTVVGDLGGKVGGCQAAVSITWDGSKRSIGRSEQLCPVSRGRVYAENLFQPK
jgi:hypothetical protein